MQRTVLSLFDYTGNWPSFYAEAGYNVVCVDLKRGHDILQIDQRWIASIGPVHGVLAAPPCTDFAGSGAQYWKQKDQDGRTAQSVALVQKTLQIIHSCNPHWWVIENPVGRLPSLVNDLLFYGPTYFHPYEFGGWLEPGQKSHSHPLIPPNDSYRKKTGLWGKFRFPNKKPCAPVSVTCYNGDNYSPIHWNTGGKSEKTKEIRSVTPLGFAKAFFHANP
jgi:hypothetical protein